jgi:ABC-type phosphate transport system auxiliary subunit
MNVSLWILPAAIGASLLAQGLVLHVAHRRRLAKLQAHHQLLEQDANTRLEQAKQQVGQLQNELGTARVQLRQLGRPAAPSAQAALMARQALERELEQGTLEHADAAGGDGFADTEITLHDTQYGSLLLQ